MAPRARRPRSVGTSKRTSRSSFDGPAALGGRALVFVATRLSTCRTITDTKIDLSPWRHGALGMELVTANVVLQIGTDRLQANYTVPAGPISATDLLPIARVLLQTILQIAEAELASRGSRVSCTKGCGACCRQLVPISEADALCAARSISIAPRIPASRITTALSRRRRPFARLGFVDQVAESG